MTFQIMRPERRMHVISTGVARNEMESHEAEKSLPRQMMLCQDAEHGAQGRDDV